MMKSASINKDAVWYEARDEAGMRDGDEHVKGCSLLQYDEFNGMAHRFLQLQTIVQEEEEREVRLGAGKKTKIKRGCCISVRIFFFSYLSLPTTSKPLIKTGISTHLQNKIDLFSLAFVSLGRV